MAIQTGWKVPSKALADELRDRALTQPWNGIHLDYVRPRKWWGVEEVRSDVQPCPRIPVGLPFRFEAECLCESVPLNWVDDAASIPAYPVHRLVMESRDWIEHEDRWRVWLGQCPACHTIYWDVAWVEAIPKPSPEPPKESRLPDWF